jgi:hypothetical protein
MATDPPKNKRGPANKRGRQREIDGWEWEVEIPSQFAALGTLASALLPHVPLLHAWLVLLQLSLRPTKDTDGT